MTRSRLRSRHGEAKPFSRAQVLTFVLVLGPILAFALFALHRQPQPVVRENPTAGTPEALPPVADPPPVALRPPQPPRPPPPQPPQSQSQSHASPPAAEKTPANDIAPPPAPRDPPVAPIIQGARAMTFFPPPGFTLETIPRVNGTLSTIEFPAGLPSVSLYGDNTVPESPTTQSVEIAIDDAKTRAMPPKMTDEESETIRALPGVADALNVAEGALILRVVRDLLSAPQAHNISTYLEFGCGGSTTVTAAVAAAAAANDSSRNLRMIAVDSSKDWLDIIATRFANDSRLAPVLKPNPSIGMQPLLRLRWVNIGPLKNWGRPEDTSARENWPGYPRVVDEVVDAADLDAAGTLVYVDGRFRVACVLRAFLRVGPRAMVMIHDFWKRPEYFVVLEFSFLKTSRDRMVVLIRRNVVDEDKIRRLLNEYQWDYA